MSFESDHERDSKRRHKEMQDKLGELVAASDEAGIRLLSARLDAQLKLEDFLIRFREANHAKLKVWSPIFVSGAVSLIVTLLTLFLGKH
jgi:hypothetical protein